MPAFIKTKDDEKRWDKAKAIAIKSGKFEKGSDRFWAYVNGIYQRMSGNRGKPKDQPQLPFDRIKLAEIDDKELIERLEQHVNQE